MNICGTLPVLLSHQYIARAHKIEPMVSISLTKIIQSRQARRNDKTHIKNATNNLNGVLSLCQYCLELVSILCPETKISYQ